MHGRIALVVAAIAVALAWVLPAQAGPQEDFDRVYADWKPDNDVTACAFSQAELQSAYDVATGSPDFQYSTAFTDEVQREIARWRSGGCSGVAPLSARRVSPIHGARLTAVRGRGNTGKEYVKVKNTGKKTIPFKKASVRNLKKQKAVFPATFKLKPGKTAVVRMSCAKGKRRASFKGLRVNLCRKSQLFKDRGDAARLADPKGTVVSQRAYGTETRRLSY